VQFVIASVAKQSHDKNSSHGIASSSKTPRNDTALIKVFTTRADTLFGVTYVVLAPEHPLVPSLTLPEQKKAVDAYIAEAAKQSDIERMSTTREKTGVFTGSYCTNPANGQKVPVYIADYCLANYGTGAVMAVPAHDERDFDFAKKFGLPIIEVVSGQLSVNKPKIEDYQLSTAFVADGILVNCGKFDGLTSAEAREKIVVYLGDKATQKINYRLRDWSISRQRYWGAPIPVIHCSKCGIVADEKLPVELPYAVEFKPDGGSPLAKCDAFINVKCPKCGINAKRDADTLDTFVCSSWYFLRYPDAKNAKAAFDTKLINSIMPVDKYVGGAEHACMHLLYARFFTKCLRDMGYLNFDEPFTSLVHQGVVLGADGQKMSKSKGNVVNPDIYVNEYGSDIFRMYLMFGFSFIEGGPWNDDGIKAIARFFERIERIIDKAYTAKGESNAGPEVDFVLHNTIKAINEDLEVFSFNTAIARLFELVNAMYRHDAAGGSPADLKDACRTLILLLAPFAPHFAEELWTVIATQSEAKGKQSHVKGSVHRIASATPRNDGYTSIFNQPYPKHDPAKLAKASVEVAVQINSRVKCKITIPSGLTQADIEKTALTDPAVIAALSGATPKKIIVIPDRLINIVV